MLQYNKYSKQPYVEVEKEDGSFENRDVELGVSGEIRDYLWTEEDEMLSMEQKSKRGRIKRFC